MLGGTGEAGTCPGHRAAENAWLLIAGDESQLDAHGFSSICMACLKDGRAAGVKHELIWQDIVCRTFRDTGACYADDECT